LYIINLVNATANTSSKENLGISSSGMNIVTSNQGAILRLH